MLQIALRKASGGQRFSAVDSGVEFFEADALALPCADESFDLVASAFGFRNLANYERGLAEIRRVLRPGGELAILEFAEPQSRVFGALYRVYFHRVLPRIGAAISGNSSAYSYLPASVQKFPSAADFGRMLSRAGFSEIGCEKWTGGIVALHTGRRSR
jgi:demethylmenaquinone methyltransferase/2-methoxy-6-polyprenyl-1,4-benzoquinol methylase